MSLTGYAILDLRSGTFFDAADACIINMNDLREEELEDFNEGHDRDRRDIAELHGVDIEQWASPTANQALDAVAELLSSSQWSSDHICAVADIVRSTGRTISDI